MKNLFLILFLFTLVISCIEPTNTSDIQNAVKTERIMLEADAQVGLPNIHHFQEKKIMKQIMELRDDENLVCYAYVSTYTGIHYLGKCVGYGLPYSTQYTNPEKRIGDGIDGEIATLPQAEANGLFMPDNTNATWLVLLDKNNNPRVVYVESDLIVSPVPLEIEGKQAAL